jgi:hypothetical protein
MRDRYRAHVLVLPEDDANRQIANGFQLGGGVDLGPIQVLPPCGGWMKVLKCLERDQLVDLRRFPQRILVLVIDFDGVDGRLDEAKARIPADVLDRVFIIGARIKPETLKRTLPGRPSFESIGKALAEDCRANTRTIWGTPDLVCNSAELDRMTATVSRCLFG